MKRRSFLSLSALSAVSVPAVSIAAEEPVDGWYDTIQRDTLKIKAVSEEGNLVLQVELLIPPEDEVTEVKDEKGEFRCFQYEGKDQPYPFRPGCTLLTRFDLTWDGKAMNIPERFWNDLPDLRFETSTPRSEETQTGTPLEGGTVSRIPPPTPRLPRRQWRHLSLPSSLQRSMLGV